MRSVQKYETSLQRSTSTISYKTVYRRSYFGHKDKPSKITLIFYIFSKNPYILTGFIFTRSEKLSEIFNVLMKIIHEKKKK
ncbi:hypothetical protein BpHYR1_045673 [Brachionus plicatilis]|uniref:Uncharacterized protein n=1 Tax=Brachionus plicatilis TaxID=10195 RepID=A0A3M7PMB6_BRAPC|nr:hypothetical protein BpHYR1_045673 [Brachionus plicatilis]